MKNKILRNIIPLMAISIILPTYFIVRLTGDGQEIVQMDVNQDAGANTVVLDLKNARDTRELQSKIQDSGFVRARLRSFRIEKRTSGIKASVAAGMVENPVAKGISWLKNNQKQDGRWSKDGKLDLIETTAVTSLFSKIQGQGFPEYQRALEWLRLVFPENSDYIAEKVVELEQAGDDMETLAEFLASQINEQDQGFGYQKDYQSDLITTAKVLNAISTVEYQDAGNDPAYTLKATLLSLLSSQDPDGGWPKLKEAQSDVKTTTFVLEALNPYRTYTLGDLPQGDIVIPSKIELGLEYLKNTQSTDGSWQDVEGTAKAYEVLLTYQQYPRYNLEAVTYLRGRQNPEGSFADRDVYVTAKAVQALAKPDIAVTEIKNISATIPNTPTVAAITMRNLGYFNTQPINMKREPHTFHLLVDGKELDIQYEPSHPDTIVLEPDATLIFEVDILNLAFGRHNIGFSVDYQGVEFDKTNNQEQIDLVFDDPGFQGPTPPSWVGARTGVEPNQIILIWIHSDDSAKAQYRLFFGATSGKYDSYFDIPGEHNVVTLTGAPHDIPIFFSVVSVDGARNRGDYSMETSARGYNNPADYKGTVPLLLKDNNQKLLYDVALNFFAVTTINSGTINPIFVSSYPGFYYITASKSGYVSVSRALEIKPVLIGEQIEFVLPIVDDGVAPPPVENLRVQAGDSEMTLIWDQLRNPPADFSNFNVYRATIPIATIRSLTPLDTTIINPSTNSFVDRTIINGIDYYYAVTTADLAGNENDAVGIGPFRGNSLPLITNINVSPVRPEEVQIRYELADREQNSVSVSMEYWNGIAWQQSLTVVGGGTQVVGTQKVLSWNAKQDYTGHYGDTKIRIIADDRQQVNNRAVFESGSFFLDTTTCGNGLIEGPEVCDGANLARSTCTNRGFVRGVLKCSVDCRSFNTARCTNNLCEFEPGVLLFDQDRDGDVDLSDQVSFQTYFSGSDVSCYARRAGCGVFDADGDGDVDRADQNLMKQCFTGPR